ncbi:protein of unknown function [Parasphingorhabdus marina DSM 22363]|uniref:DUF4136 domain-containing protein n=1 Tax=Parasphingorhabdus marina DSM 22363 TaxID=1123272 RepID=A0A1N6CQW4_9SPHN|nr:DUF4136 domain-containing protein [Parasphingorhabdus marina]SIN60835.1 protein of unknown function [Parasphingorhabdus marina DSM 22363]
MRIQRLAIATGMSIALAACATTTPPVSVTRFHNAETMAIGTGTVTIAPAVDGEEGGSLEKRTYDVAVLRELQRVGFQESLDPSEASEYLVRVLVDQSVLTAGGQRSPVSVGVGGRTGGYRSGVGLGIGINLGGKPKDKIVTELSVRISRQSDGNVVWEGRSSIEAKQGSPASQPGLAASRLAEALFRDFPGQSGSTIRVP